MVFEFEAEQGPSIRQSSLYIKVVCICPHERARQHKIANDLVGAGFEISAVRLLVFLPDYDPRAFCKFYLGDPGFAFAFLGDVELQGSLFKICLADTMHSAFQEREDACVAL